MKTENDFLDSLLQKVSAFGAFKAGILPAGEVETDASFREMCESNSCGMYGKCWTCPPDIGPFDKLQEQLGSYQYLLLYQTVGELEDSFDFESMQQWGENHNQLAQKLRHYFDENQVSDCLHLGVGGCRLCPVCAKRSGEPCRHPEQALSSLEAYGIYVAKTAEKAGMKYINGKDTVTYFGGIFFNL